MKKDQFAVVVKGSAVGLAVCVVAALSLAGCISALVYNELLGDGAIDVLVTATHTIALLLGVLAAYKIAKVQNVIPSLVVAASLYFICVVAAILLFDGALKFEWMELVAGVLGTTAGAVLGQKRKRRSGKKKYLR